MIVRDLRTNVGPAGLLEAVGLISSKNLGFSSSKVYLNVYCKLQLLDLNSVEESAGPTRATSQWLVGRIGQFRSQEQHRHSVAVTAMKLYEMTPNRSASLQLFLHWLCGLWPDALRNTC